MLTVQCQTGRLIEVKAEGPVTVVEVTAFRSKFTEKLIRAAQRVVICTDLRTAEAFQEDVSSMLLGMMKSDNPLLERSAHLTSAGSAFGALLDDMVRLAKNPSRRHFQDAAELCTFLDVALSAEERVRVRAFLGLSS